MRRCWLDAETALVIGPTAASDCLSPVAISHGSACGPLERHAIRVGRAPSLCQHVRQRDLDFGVCEPGRAAMEAGRQAEDLLLLLLLAPSPPMSTDAEQGSTVGPLRSTSEVRR